MNWIDMNVNRFQEICQDLKLKNRDYTEVDKAIHDVWGAVERLKKAAEEKQLFWPRWRRSAHTPPADDPAQIRGTLHPAAT